MYIQPFWLIIFMEGLMGVERYSLSELGEQIKSGKKFSLLKPLMFKGQILINVEKILTEKDIIKLDGKVYGNIEVVSTAEHSTDDKIRQAIIDNAIKVLKGSSLYKLNDTHHLDFTKRKEVEKLFSGIIISHPQLAQKLLDIYKMSKKVFLHSIHVAIISSVVDMTIQEKRKIHNALRSEELLTAALLHEVGFLNFDKEFVEKKRHQYTPEDKITYKSYPSESKSICDKLGGNIRQKTIQIIEQHQERLPGNGFPNALKGKDIDELALILGIADEFELLVSRDSANHQKPVSEIMSRFSRTGNLFGSEIVDAFYTSFRYLN